MVAISVLDAGWSWLSWWSWCSLAISCPGGPLAGQVAATLQVRIASAAQRGQGRRAGRPAHPGPGGADHQYPCGSSSRPTNTDAWRSSATRFPEVGPSAGLTRGPCTGLLAPRRFWDRRGGCRMCACNPDRYLRV